MICLFWVWLAVLRKVPLVDFQLYFLIYKPEFTWNYDGIMELWWNLDILWWNLDRFEHKFDGNITNWPCWSEGKLGTGPFTWLGQGFQTNFSEIPFQKRENLSIYGFLTAFQSQQNWLNIDPCFLQCFAEQSNKSNIGSLPFLLVAKSNVRNSSKCITYQFGVY